MKVHQTPPVRLSGPPAAGVWQEGTPYAQRPSGRARGACLCDLQPGQTIADCTCEWGQMLDRLVRVGWNWSGTQAELERELAVNLRGYMVPIIHRHRLGVLARIARTFTGTEEDLAQLLGIARQQFVKIGFSLKKARAK